MQRRDQGTPRGPPFCVRGLLAAILAWRRSQSCSTNPEGTKGDASGVQTLNSNNGKYSSSTKQKSPAAPAPERRQRGRGRQRHGETENGDRERHIGKDKETQETVKSPNLSPFPIGPPCPGVGLCSKNNHPQVYVHLKLQLACCCCCCYCCSNSSSQDIRRSSRGAAASSAKQQEQRQQQQEQRE